MSEIALRLRATVLSLWLILFGVAHACAAAVHTPENRIWEISDIGYDAVASTNVSYDNYGVLDDFDSLLTPQMIVPTP